MPSTELENGASIVELSPQKIPYVGQKVTQIIDAMGSASATAQGLGSVITTHAKFIQSFGDQILYLIVKQKKVLAMLKTGTKSLFLQQ